MSINITGVVLAFVFGVIATLAIKACTSEQLARMRNDKALQAARQDSITVNNRIDSSLNLAESMKQESDSLKLVIGDLQVKRQSTSRDLTASKARVIDLLALIGTARESGDLHGKLMNCDSLVEENMNLIGLVTQYEAYTDSVERIHADNDRLRDSIDSERVRLIAQLREAFNRASSNYLQSLLERTVKKEKRFSVGPAIGGGIGSGLKPTGFAGITLQYSFFKF